MIRRNLPLGPKPREWLLISQVEHARISGELAACWGSDDVSPVVCPANELGSGKMAVRREVLAAIGRHDDGWAAWETAPKLDAEQGRPLDFMEMPLADALRIWSDSIHAARREGPLAGSMVAGHFLALLDGSQHAQESSAITWRESTTSLRSGWLGEWYPLNPTIHTPDLAKRALRWLQCFDWLSLWLFCKCPLAVDEVPAESPVIEFDAPGASGRVRFHCTGPVTERSVSADPWPFVTPDLSFTARCRAVPVKVYRTTHDLLAACRPEQLQLLLIRG